MKPGSKVTAIILLFVGLVLVNYLASSVPLRIDATAESIYSLSSGTQALLKKIEEPITLDLYFSKDASGLPIRYKNYATRVQEMLRQYVRASSGKLVLNVINPRPDTPEEERATAAGISPQISQQGGEQFFFGLVVTQADQQKNLPAFTPQREPFLEYDLSKLIHSVQQFEKPKLGLLTSLPLKGASPQDMRMAMMMRQPPQPSQFVINEWEQSFNLVAVEPTATELPAGLDALAVIHPQNLTEKLQFAIDQFLLGGKPVLLAVDPASQYFKRQGGQQAMFGGPQPNVSSDLPTLLGAYGISYDAQKLVGDLENGTDLQNPQTRQVSRYPTWLSLRRDFFNTKVQPAASLNSLLFVEAGAVAAKPGSSLTFTPLVETSAQSGDVAAAMIQFSGADELARQITPSGKKALAALVTGKFKTAFPNGAPKDPPPANDQKSDSAAATPAPATTAASPDASSESLKESTNTSTLFVIADTDWLFDDFSLEKYNLFGQTAVQPLNDNLAFAANSLEFLGGSQDLISIRGKGSSLRPFTVVREMEVEAQKKYQEKLTRLEARLQEVQTKLSELQGKKTEGNRLVATPEMTKAIEDFRKQQAQLSGERRQIRRALREDIDSLENRLLILNLLSTPLLAGVFGFWFYRNRRR
jgi:ABC-type uncharacterized transport system involved in gliding motility auxiliary subunit